MTEAQSKSWPASETQISRVETPPVISSGAEVVDADLALDGLARAGSSAARTKASAAIGRPTKKQPRQPSGESTITPPMSGPLTVASAKTAPM